MNFTIVAKDAFCNVASVFFGIPLSESDSVKVKFNAIKDWLDCTSFISMNGNKVDYLLAISSDLNFVSEVYARIFNEKISEINSEAGDLIGEACNQTAGRIKTVLSPNGHMFDMATPVVAFGNKLRLRNMADVEGVLFSFHNDIGKLNFFVHAKERIF